MENLEESSHMSGLNSRRELAKRLEDLPARRIIHIDVSNMTQEEADEYVAKIMAKYRNLKYKKPSRFKMFLNRWLGWIKGWHC